MALMCTSIHKYAYISVPSLSQSTHPLCARIMYFYHRLAWVYFLSASLPHHGKKLAMWLWINLFIFFMINFYLIVHKLDYHKWIHLSKTKQEITRILKQRDDDSFWSQFLVVINPWHLNFTLHIGYSLYIGVQSSMFCKPNFQIFFKEQHQHHTIHIFYFSVQSFGRTFKLMLLSSLKHFNQCKTTWPKDQDSKMPEKFIKEYFSLQKYKLNWAVNILLVFCWQCFIWQNIKCIYQYLNGCAL